MRTSVIVAGCEKLSKPIAKHDENVSLKISDIVVENARYSKLHSKHLLTIERNFLLTISQLRLTFKLLKLFFVIVCQNANPGKIPT